MTNETSLFSGSRLTVGLEREPSTENKMLTDAEIAGHMGWRGPGAYTEREMRKVKAAIVEAVAREREACAKVCEVLYGGPGKDFWEDGPAFAEAIRARSNN